MELRRDELSILYRGSLSSCNYDCHYCPFAKTHNTAEELREDKAELQRFVSRVEDLHCDSGVRPQSLDGFRFRILFTPWGEALTRPWYRQALVALSQMTHVNKVAVQTNLSGDLEWFTQVDRAAAALWCTWHPSQVSRQAFLRQCRELIRLGITFSVGVVGLKEDLDQIEALRRELPPTVYVWANAYKRVAQYYSESDVHRLLQVDPLFQLNNTYYPSLNRVCRTGESVVSIDGAGNIRRCHFIDTVIGNFYDDTFFTCRKPRRCTNATCGCHIGYVHLEHLHLDEVYGEHVLERIPANVDAPRQ